MMKKLISSILTLALCAALLSGCGSRTATDGNAYASGGDAYASWGNATDGNIFATDGDATDGDAALPSEGNEPAAPVTTADTGALTDALTDLRQSYHPGTAGCSLTAARLAGTLMDWYLASGADVAALRDVSAQFGDPGADEFGVTYQSQLTDVYYAAMGLYGENGKGQLESAGYVSDWGGSYAAFDVNMVFSTLFDAFGGKAPILVRVFRSDDQAERFLVFVQELPELTAQNVLKALQDMDVIDPAVAVNSLTMDNGCVKLDLSAAFLPRLQQNGTSGEYMLMGALVNTFLSAYDAQTLLLTVDGQAPESGHNVYDYAMEWYNDNVGEV